ncbi:MAG TPA: AraC family transcriptional regulator [Syntrophomonadaceae bacterium]|nr:AraC family transcriptional regulator [Syntrophomonadaceae bacterium]
MDGYKDIAGAIEYIEEHLNEHLRVEDVARCINMSYYHFHRVFYARTGEMIGDYIRKRRLTRAACELLNTNRRILDIALEYQWESQEAFSRAFKLNFGCSPGVFRRKGTRPFLASMGSLEGEKLEYRMKQTSIFPTVVTIPESKVIMGLKGTTSINNNRLPGLWEMFRYRRYEITPVVNPEVSYGICIAEQDIDILSLTEDTEYTEMVGMEVYDTENLPEGMCIYHITAGEYAVFTHQGSLARIREIYDYIWGTWAANSPYQIDQGDDFEVYDKDFYGPDNSSSVVRIFIPIKQ